MVDFTAKPASVLKGVKARVEAGIDFTAGEFQDGAKAGEVTARWTGIIVPPRPGRYRLVAATTDPVRVRIEGKLVIDTVAARAGKREAMVTLLDRPAAIVVDFSVPNTAVHRLKLTWVPVGGSDSEAIPPECLYHDRKAETGIGK